MQVSLNTRISFQIAQALDKYAAESSMSKASIVETALREYLERAKKEEGRRK